MRGQLRRVETRPWPETARPCCFQRKQHFDLVALASPQVGQLEETDQLLPIDTLAIVLKPNRRLIHVRRLPQWAPALLHWRARVPPCNLVNSQSRRWASRPGLVEQRGRCTSADIATRGCQLGQDGPLRYGRMPITRRPETAGNLDAHHRDSPSQRKFVVDRFSTCVEKSGLSIASSRLPSQHPRRLTGGAIGWISTCRAALEASCPLRLMRSRRRRSEAFISSLEMVPNRAEIAGRRGRNTSQSYVSKMTTRITRAAQTPISTRRNMFRKPFHS